MRARFAGFDAAVDRFAVLFAALLAPDDRLLVAFAGAVVAAAVFAVDLVEALLLAALLRGAVAGAAFFAVPRLAGAVLALALALRVLAVLRAPVALLGEALRAPAAEALRVPVALPVAPAVRAPDVLRAVALRGPAVFAAAAPPVDAVPSETVAVAAAFRSESMAFRQDALRL